MTAAVLDSIGPFTPPPPQAQPYLPEGGNLNSSTIVFVDRRVDNYQPLLDNLSPTAQIVLLDPSQDGIAQITHTLADAHNLASVHVLAHADVAQVQLGSTTLSLDTFNAYRSSIASWSDALTPDADLLFYGCNLAAGTEGAELMQAVATLTGADVAASTTLTGSSQLGGDWTLEWNSGSIETTLPFAPAALEDFDSVLYNFTRARYTTANVIDFTALGYTYDEGYHNNFDVLPANAAQTSGLSVRKNAATLTTTEISAFVNALKTLKTTMTTTDNGQRVSIYDQFVATHAATRDAQGRLAPDGTVLVNPAHGGNSFFPWHRTFLYEFEEALQSVDPSVTIPYWDWTDASGTMNTIFQNSFMGPDGTVNNEVRSGPFSVANGWTVRRDLSGSRWTGLNSGTIALTRNLGLVTGLGTVAQVDSALNLTTYNDFRKRVEASTGMHNNMHSWIGGMMGNVTGAPNDPMFWMLHANVDRLWAEWQLNNHWGNNFYRTGPYGQNLNDPMFPWDNGAVQVAADLQDLMPNLPGTATTTAINGNTTINGNLTVGSNTVVSPGNSPGRVRVKGDYRQQQTGEMTIEIAGRKAGRKYDVLKVDGTANLDGTLNLYFLDGFQPKVGDSFHFLKADKIKGDFDKVNVFGLKKSYQFELEQEGGTYCLTIVGRKPTSTKQGFAVSREALQADRKGKLYNPAFGETIDHYLYGFGPHHGWGKAALEVEHTDGHSSECNWYMPLHVDEVKLFNDLLSGKKVDKELLRPTSETDPLCHCQGDHSTHDHGHGHSHGHSQGHHHNDDHAHQHSMVQGNHSKQHSRGNRKKFWLTDKQKVDSLKR